MCYDIVEKYGISQLFHWLGHRIHSSQLIAGFNCFVLTSISEGLTTSLLECMTSKTPFAFFEGNGGLKDMVNLNQQFGPMAVVAESGNIENLVSGICKLIENPSIGAKYSEIAYNVG